VRLSNCLVNWFRSVFFLSLRLHEVFGYQVDRQICCGKRLIFHWLAHGVKICAIDDVT